MHSLSRCYLIFGVVIVVALAALFIYGLITDCPDTASYFNCSAVKK